MNEPFRQWFQRKGWTPFPFQLQAWQAYAEGRSGLIHAPTGTGKTYATWLGPLYQWLASEDARTTGRKRPEPPPIQVLWITPLRALAQDTVVSLSIPLLELGIPWTVEMRTGDSSAAQRRRQKAKLPSALVTTPESLSLILSYDDARTKLASLKCVIVDEWHELLSSKRGTQTELALARLRHWNPSLQTWGLSATLGNLQQAMHVLLGSDSSRGELISGNLNKPYTIETLIPNDMERFPWAGHLGLRLLPEVIAAVERASSSLVFTNTRSQAERWYQAMLAVRPDWESQVGLHHGSIDRDLRTETEDRLRAGSIRSVVCTSSLDLGVDFSPVDQVIQIGSPKGVARLLQRTGRSGHQPGSISRCVCVPTNAFELIEFAAARTAAHQCAIESREPLELALDVLVQHMVTVAVGGGFREEELFEEVRRSYAFRHLTREHWSWALDFVTRGGPALKAYPDYCRLVETDGVYKPATLQVSRRHRMSIGTITSDGMMQVQFMKGGRLGSVEESFIARLRPGDTFMFAGRLLELFRVRDMVAYVRLGRGKDARIPRWMGGRLPLSSELGRAVLRKFTEINTQPEPRESELEAIAPLLSIQSRWSHLPDEAELLIEETKSREGFHAYVYPFEGRLAHEGLAALLAYRLTRRAPRSVTVAVNDYGLELLSGAPLDLQENDWRVMLSSEHLAEDLIACLNATELARRQFRDIARVAGLIFPGFPGSGKTARQLQVSSGLLYDVLSEYDSKNLLLDQARREVFERQLEVSRIRNALKTIAKRNLRIVCTPRLTPLAFPIWAERIEAQVSTERWSDRVRRMAVQLESINSKETLKAKKKDRPLATESTTSGSSHQDRVPRRRASPPPP